MTDENGAIEVKIIFATDLCILMKKMLKDDRMLPPGIEEEVPEPTAEPAVEPDEPDKATSTDNYNASQFVLEVRPFDDIFTLTLIFLHLSKSKKDAEKQQLNYHKADTSNASWLQKYMKNMNYNVIETDMNGDCFFSAIVEAFTPIGQITTVGQLRKKLSREVTEDLFNNYQNQFLTAVQTYKAETANLKTLETEYKKYQALSQTQLPLHNNRNTF